MTLEKLLNRLIEMGWKPWGEINSEQDISIITDKYRSIRIGKDYNKGVKVLSLNDLCSIDSGLWQFVVENNLYGGPLCVIEETKHWKNGVVQKFLASNNDLNGNYFAMKSSIQKDKEKFLLDNILLPKDNKDG